MNKNKWTPAVPSRPRNLIVSSDAVANGIRPFQPRFEKECEPNMSNLLSNEYMRMWFDERTEYQKKIYLEGTIKPDIKNRKKYIPRPKPKKNVKELPPITLPRFQNIPSKIDNRR